jgi:hypothetical protein
VVNRHHVRMAWVERVSPTRRAALFLAVGVLFFLRWRQVGSVDFQHPETLADWLAVVGFSIALFGLAIALPVFSELTSHRTVFRTSMVPGFGCALGGMSNLLEDGLQWSWAFWGFVAGLAIVNLGLVALTLLIALMGRGPSRLLATVPALTLAGVLLFELVGGLLMLAAWSGAAIVAIRSPQPERQRVGR